MEGLIETNSHAGSNSATESDRVKAPMVGAGPIGYGRGQNQIEGGGGPQTAQVTTGKSGDQAALENPGSVDRPNEEVEVFARRDSLKKTPPMARKLVAQASRKLGFRTRAGSAGDLSDLILVFEDNKRKRHPKKGRR